MTPEEERARHLRSVPYDDPPDDDPGESDAWAHAHAAGADGARGQGGQQTQQAWPTHDPHAEAAVLSALLSATPEQYEHVEGILALLAASDFYEPRHELVYTAVCAVHARGAGIDPVAVVSELRNAKTLTAAGGQAYIAELHGALVPAVMGEGHAASLVRYSERRAAAGLGRALLSAAEHATDEELAGRVAEELRHGAERMTPRGPALSTWAPVDLSEILASDVDPSPVPSVLRRRDGTALLYPGAIHSISGEPGSGKSWLAVLGVAQEITEERPVLYLDFEDRAATFVARLRDVGVPDHLIGAHLRYARPEVALDAAGQLALARAAEGCAFGVVDGITEAMTLHALSLMDNQDVATFLALLPHRLAHLGMAVLQVDHVVKDSEARGRYAIGGQHKLAGITGAAYKAVVARSMGRGVRGSTRIVVDKDKHGRVGPTGITAAELILDATPLDPEGRWHRGQTECAGLWMEQAAPETNEAGDFRPTGLMEKVSRFLEINPGASGRNITDVIKGKAEHVRTALQVLAVEGYVSLAPGPHRSTLHFSDRPYREADDR